MLSEHEERRVDKYLETIKALSLRAEITSPNILSIQWLAEKLKLINEEVKRLSQLDVEEFWVEPELVIIQNVENKPAVVSFWDDSQRAYRCVACRGLSITIDSATRHTREHFKNKENKNASSDTE